MALLGIVIGTTSEREYPVKGALFAVGVVVVIFTIVDGFVMARKAHANTPDGTPAPEKSRFVKVAAFALVSFTIYAMAIPDTPFEPVADALGITLNVVAGVLVLLTGFTLPRIAAWLDVPAEDADQGSR